jgi:hypothetical protein
VIADHDEAPVLEVAPAGGADRGVEEARDQLVRDVPVLHASHRAGRVERFEDVHSSPGAYPAAGVTAASAMQATASRAVVGTPNRAVWRAGSRPMR